MVQKLPSSQLQHSHEDDMSFTLISTEPSPAKTSELSDASSGRELPKVLSWRDFRGRKHEVDTKHFPTVEPLRQHIKERIDVGSYGLMLAWRGRVLYDEDQLNEISKATTVQEDPNLAVDHGHPDCDDVTQDADEEIGVVLSTDYELWFGIKDSLGQAKVDIDLRGFSLAEGLVLAVQRAVGYVVVRAFPWTSLLELAKAFECRMGNSVGNSVYFHQQRPVFDGVGYCRGNGHVVRTLELANVGPGSVMRLLKMKIDKSGRWVYE